MSRSVRTTSTYRDRGSSSSSSIEFNHSKTLHLPDERSSDKTWTGFFYDCTSLAQRGYSLTVAFGENPDGSISSPYRMARKLMTPRENKEYQEWESTHRVPRVDWNRTRKSINATTSKQRERWEELAAGLRFLYDDSHISRENAKGWVEKYKDYMTLLIAAKKVEITRKDIQRAKNVGSSGVRYVREAIACRKLLSEIGIFRGELGRSTKDFNIKLGKREAEVLKDVDRLESRVRDPSEAFRTRQKLFDRLEKIRTERVANSCRHTLLMAESKCAEDAIRSRLNTVNSILSSGERRRR